MQLMEKEVEDEIYSDTNYGANIGLDIIYKTQSGFVFGVGGKYNQVDARTLSQIQGKIGFSFK